MVFIESSVENLADSDRNMPHNALQCTDEISDPSQWPMLVNVDELTLPQKQPWKAIMVSSNVDLLGNNPVPAFLVEQTVLVGSTTNDSKAPTTAGRVDLSLMRRVLDSGNKRVRWSQSSGWKLSPCIFSGALGCISK
jgi:hypothetical protein